jgi:replicative DNA helicase
MIRDLAKDAVFSERCILGSLWLRPGLWGYASELSPADFLLEDHRVLFEAICHINARQEVADVANVTRYLDTLYEEGTAHAARLAALWLDCEFGVVPEGIQGHVRYVKKASQERRRVRELAAEFSEITGDSKYLPSSFEVTL